MLNRVFGTVLFATLCAASQGQIVVNMATKDGETISGDKKFRVTVQSQSQVSQVEFYINGNLVATDDSTPYELALDTLNYDDGPLKVTIAAYNSSGESKKVELTLKVDNGLALGVKHHVGLAEKGLIDQKWDEAIAALRVALKIDPKDNSARLTMARAYFGKKVYDLAEKYARDVVESDPSDLPARDLLAGISLRSAFHAMETSADRDHTIETISVAFQTASRVRRDSLLERVIRFGPATEANRLSYADLMSEAGRFSLAIDELTPAFAKDERNTEVADRLLYAQLRAGRYVDARTTLRRHIRAGTPDGYGYAIKAVVDNWFGDEVAAIDAEREALLSDPGNMGVRTAQAFLALRRGNTATFNSIARGLGESSGASAISNYYLCSMYYAQGQFSQSDAAFQTGLLADPTLYHLYLERFNQSISYYLSTKPQGKEKDYQLNFAKAFADAALQAKPESFEALTALALIEMFREKWGDAVRLAQAATAAGPQYPAAHYVLAGADFAAGLPDEGIKMIAKAAELDPSSLTGIRAPSTIQAWLYFSRRGRTPLLAPPSG